MNFKAKNYDKGSIKKAIIRILTVFYSLQAEF